MRSISGTVEVPGREFFFSQINAKEGFRTLVNAALQTGDEIPLPHSGGIIEGKVRVLLEDGTTLLAVSYKGDLEGWRANLIHYCNLTHRKWGIASNNRIVMSDGTHIDLLGAQVEFEP